VNKYIATPRGLFELRYFFGSALADADGGIGHSAEAVRTRIKTLIEAEPATAVLSDDRIAEILRTEASRSPGGQLLSTGNPCEYLRRRSVAGHGHCSCVETT